MSKYKNSMSAEDWWYTALRVERKKFAAVPVKVDLVPNSMFAQAWGHVLTAYRLVEMGLKLIWVSNGHKGVFTGHQLLKVWSALEKLDRNMLSQHYVDACEYGGDYPHGYTSLEDFLKNLDQEGNGWKSWAYFPIEDFRDQEAFWVDNGLPQVSISVMHEIAGSCRNLLVAKRCGFSSWWGSRSWREYRNRWEPGGRLRAWLEDQVDCFIQVAIGPDDGEYISFGESSRMGSFVEEDRVDILEGPDYAGRYDYLICKDGIANDPVFDLLPKETPELPHRDRRGEVLVHGGMFFGR